MSWNKIFVITNLVKIKVNRHLLFESFNSYEFTINPALNNKSEQSIF